MTPTDNQTRQRINNVLCHHDMRPILVKQKFNNEIQADIFNTNYAYPFIVLKDINECPTDKLPESASTPSQRRRIVVRFVEFPNERLIRFYDDENNVVAYSGMLTLKSKFGGTYAMCFRRWYLGDKIPMQSPLSHEIPTMLDYSRLYQRKLTIYLKNTT